MFEKYRFGRSVNGEVENEKKQEGSMRTILVAIHLFAASSANAQQVAPAPKFIRENSPVIALTHVQLIGAGGPDYRHRPRQNCCGGFRGKHERAGGRESDRCEGQDRDSRPRGDARASFLSDRE
jgi:hypothetical protein